MLLVDQIAKLMKGPMPLHIRQSIVELGEPLLALEGPFELKLASIPHTQQQLRSITAALHELKQDLNFRRAWPSAKARAPENHRERRIWELQWDILLAYSEVAIVVARLEYEVELFNRFKERFEFALEHFKAVRATWESTGERKDRATQAEQDLELLREDLEWLSRDQEWLKVPNPLQEPCAQVEAKLVELKTRALAISEARPEPASVG
jgi:hypothetical protein